MIGEFSAAGLWVKALKERECAVSVCIPAHNEGDLIANAAGAAMFLKKAELVDQVLVVDDRSDDETATVARGLGAEVIRSGDLCSHLGPVQGRNKGDVMWRALEALTGEAVVYVDGDSGPEFGPDHIIRLAGPLVTDEADFVKATYERPLRKTDGTRISRRGGRVNERIKPILLELYPELEGIEQPLAGEIGAKKRLLDRMPYTMSYGVEVCHLIDALAIVGAGRIGQIDLGVRQNRHRSDEAMETMFQEVQAAILGRAQPDRFPRAAERPARVPS